MPQSWIYILANKRNGTLYVGVTNNLIKRVNEHKEGIADGFTKKYGIKMLVYFEEYEHIQKAIDREKQIKKWNRLWKINLIESKNKEWKDLFKEII
jgi:putative endonuclease